MQRSLSPHSPTTTRRWRIVRAMLTLNVAALVAAYLSGHWDIAEHVKGAVDRFWYPPHYGIYMAILSAALLSLGGLIVLLRERGLPFDVLRRNAALTLVVIANSVSFTGAPFDAWWHTAFGLDLTVWSPPHLHLLLGLFLSGLGCVVYFLDDAPLKAPLRFLNKQAFDGRYLLVIFTLTVALLGVMFLFIEYEGGLRSRDVMARPRWSYPVLWSCFACFIVALCTAATRQVGTATLVATVYVLARVASLWFDRAILDFRGFFFYPLVIPALLFDLGVALWWLRWGSRQAWQMLTAVGLVVAMGVALTTPLWWSLLRIAPELNVQPWLTAWPMAIVAGVLGVWLGWSCGTLLRRLRPATVTSPDLVDVPQRASNFA